MRDQFALRHQARRAKQLAAVLRVKWEDVEDNFGMDLADAAARLSDEGWANAAAEVERLTGKPFRTPSETTRQICIGLLSMPELSGLLQ